MKKLRFTGSVITAPWLAFAGIAAAVFLAGSLAARPPETRTDTVTDTLHGVVIEDPYRWLEDGAAAEVIDWTEAQWEYLRTYLDSYPDKDKIEARMKELLTVGSIGTPTVCDDLYFFKRREGSQNHSVLIMQKGLQGEPVTLLDPNTFSDDGTVALDWYYFSPDGSLMAYGKSASGSERSTLYLMRTSDRRPLADTIPYTRAASLAWLPDNSGFFYTRTATPGTVPADDEDYYRRVYYHEIGSDWQNDPLMFGDQVEKTAWTGVSSSDNGDNVLYSAFQGWSEVDWFYQDRTAPEASPVGLTSDVSAYFEMIPLDDRFIVKTNWHAPHFRVMVGRYDRPMPEDWVEIVPERESIINSVSVIAGHLVVKSLKNAYSVLEVFTLNGEPVTTMRTPAPGTIRTVSGEVDGNEMFYSFSSYNVPTTIFRYDFETDSTSQWAQIDAGVDVSDIVVKQVWYDSKDGTPISMFVVHREGIALDGSNPTYLSGYGGFSSNETPYFSRTMTFWYDQGGIYAVPNLRGGGEYGEEWHDAGKLENKQNTFDDFIAAAEYLVDEGYTSTGKLCAYGGSNGGLLTGAVLVQRPDLFGAVLVDVPLLDMLRYHLFLIARLWIPEYGSSEDPEQFKFIHEYSPYHHVEEGVDYPPVLLLASASDSRVDPMHARKMTARLQAATASDNPILLRIESKAGHGVGKPINKWVDLLTDEWSFVCKALGLRVK